MTALRMRGHAPFGPTDPNICMCGGVTDVINCEEFFVNRFWVWRLKNGISYWNRSSPLQQCCATAQTVIIHSLETFALFVICICIDYQSAYGYL